MKKSILILFTVLSGVLNAQGVYDWRFVPDGDRWELEYDVDANNTFTNAIVVYPGNTIYFNADAMTIGSVSITASEINTLKGYIGVISTPTLTGIGINTVTTSGNSYTIAANEVDGSVTNELEPVGTIEFYAGSSAPTGYLICDGSAVSRTTYSALFAICGTTYGPGDGSTTFNLPDLRQRFPLGKAASGTGNVLGATGGAIDHVHAVDPPNTTTTASGNINNVTLLALGSASAPSHTHDVNISSFNSGASNPPFLVLNAIIKY